jgi:hypothetical protein
LWATRRGRNRRWGRRVGYWGEVEGQRQSGIWDRQHGGRCPRPHQPVPPTRDRPVDFDRLRHGPDEHRGKRLRIDRPSRRRARHAGRDRLAAGRTRRQRGESGPVDRGRGVAVGELVECRGESVRVGRACPLTAPHPGEQSPQPRPIRHLRSPGANGERAVRAVLKTPLHSVPPVAGLLAGGGNNSKKSSPPSEGLCRADDMTPTAARRWYTRVGLSGLPLNERADPIGTR